MISQSHKCVGSGLSRPKYSGNFEKGQSQNHKMADRVPGSHLTAKYSCKPVIPVENVHSECMPFGVFNPPDVNNPQLGTLNPKRFWVQEIRFIQPIRCRKSLNSMVKLFFKSELNVCDIPGKLHAVVDPNKWKTPKCTRTPATVIRVDRGLCRPEKFR